MVKKNNVLKSEERRQFFRVDDEINLIYIKIDEKKVMETALVSDSILGHWSLSATLDALSQESALLLHRLGKSYPDVAEYLKILDNKIDLIAQGLVTQNSQFSKNGVRNANLSATGVAFDSEEIFKQGDYLEIKILLVNSMAVVVACGKVVYCKQNQSGDSRFPYVVGVDYVSIKDQDRELLIRHVVKRQLQQIRDKRESN